MFDRMNGIGAHEVIIETPDHDKTLATMSEPEIERVLWAFRERILDLKRTSASATSWCSRTTARRRARRSSTRTRS